MAEVIITFLIDKYHVNRYQSTNCSSIQFNFASDNSDIYKNNDQSVLTLTQDMTVYSIS